MARICLFGTIAFLLALATVRGPATAAVIALPSQAPCAVSIGGFHIGLRHLTRGNCAATSAPQTGGVVRGAPSARSGSYVFGYSRTCSMQDGHDVCVAKSGEHVSTCTNYNGRWRCTETSRKTAAQAACESRAAESLPAGPIMREGSYGQAGADTYVSARDWKSALAYEGGWTQADPGDANAWNYLGLTYAVGFHNTDAAGAAFRRANAAKPSWAQPYVGLGHVYLDEKCFDLAGAALEKAANRNPSSANSWKNAAAAYSYAGRIDLADEMLIEEQKHLGSGADAIDWYNIGCDFNKIEDPGHASAALRRSIGLNGRYANAWNNLGVANENLGDFDDALAEYQKAGALGDSLGPANYTHLQTLIAQMKSRAHRGHGRGSGGVCYDGATTVPANGATGTCPPGFGVHAGDRSDDSSSGDSGPGPSEDAPASGESSESS